MSADDRHISWWYRQITAKISHNKKTDMWEIWVAENPGRHVWRIFGEYNTRETANTVLSRLMDKLSQDIWSLA